MQNLIAILVAIGSVVLLAFIIVIAVDINHWEVGNLIWVIVGIAYAVLTLYYLRLTTAPKDSHTGLVRERRKLEEKAKINKLRSEMK
jgi:membrane protein implicated in regulation of membrane protease activity